MSLFERFITEGNEKADEPAKEGAMLDGGVMAQVRASAVQAGKNGGSCSTAICRLASTVWWQEWKDGAELKPKQKKSEFFVNKRR